MKHFYKQNFQNLHQYDFFLHSFPDQTFELLQIMVWNDFEMIFPWNFSTGSKISFWTIFTPPN